MKQSFAEELLGKFVNNVKAVGNLLMFFEFRGGFRFFDRYVIPCCEPLQCFDVTILFMLHQKADRIATAAATKTFINFLGRRDGKGGCFFVMKRTKSQIVGASLFKFNKRTDDFNNINPVYYLLYRFL